MIEVYKEYGQILSNLTEQVKRENNNQKISFIGRLDPMAAGKMIYLVGDECKKMQEYIKVEKIYSFELLLGLSTDTDDILGLIKEKKNLDLTDNLKNAIYNILESYDNYTYYQKYPNYSSYVIKKDGLRKPLWYFEKKGTLTNDDIPSHKITIKSLKINNKTNSKTNNNTDNTDFEIITDYKSFIDDINQLETKENIDLRKDKILQQYLLCEENIRNKNIENISFVKIPLIAHVTSGTYIRKLCNDIGKDLNIPALALHIKREEFIY